jgi:asparagine synthase (glutamine-hydrolysing)
LLVALMARQVTGARVKTFSVGFEAEGSAMDETDEAERTARFIGTDHARVVVGGDEVRDRINHIAYALDQPSVDGVNSYFVSLAARRDVTVAISGTGGDELFAGYSRYGHFLRNTRLMDGYRIAPSFVRALVRRQIASSTLLSSNLRRKLMHTPLGREDSVESLHLDNFCCAFSMDEQRRLLRAGESSSPYDSFLKYWNNTPFRSQLTRLLYADQKTYLVELLMKQDQMSMACSLESRVPFLDHTFVEFAARVPDRLKLRDGAGKYILKKAVEDILPHDIIYRSKMGFPTPVQDWLLDPRSEPLYALLQAPDSLLSETMDRAELRSLIERHRSRHEDATDRIWRLLNLQLWGEIFLKGNREQWWDGCLQNAAAPAA